MAHKIVGGALIALGLACGPADAPDRTPAAGAPPDSAVQSVVDERPAIVFLGTSLTAGLGVEDEQAFPALIQDTLDARGLPFRVVNAGENGATSAGGLRRIDWLLRQQVSVLVLELGANDGLRGLDVSTMRANLQTIIDRTTAAHPAAQVVLLGMQAPPNLGRDYTDAFRAVFPDLAAANNARLVPFLLDGVAGMPELNQADGIHPTARGHELLAENVWRVLAEVVGRL